jgi:DNA-binding NarL/FixJ family response regulator
MTDKAIRILCVDDHALVRDGLATVIGMQDQMEVVGSVATAEEAVASFERLRPDVTLMDLELRGASGLDAISAIVGRHPTARIVVLTVHSGNEDIYRALQAGATTYLLKDMLTKDLIRVIREVHAGARPMSSEISKLLAKRAEQPALTSREVQVLELIAGGLANREIAIALGISYETVHSHVKNILGKLDVSDRTAAVSAALKRGIIHITS